MSFVYPAAAPGSDQTSNSPSFGIGSSLAISWTDTTSAYSNATLVLMKNDDNYTCSLLNLGAAYCQAIQPAFSAFESHGIPWRVSTYDYPEYPEDTNPSFYLIMSAINASGVVSKFYSHGFFIYPEDDVPTNTYTGLASSTTTTSSTASSSASASSITASSTTASSTTASPSITSLTTSSATSTPSSGLDGSDKRAIGIAVGLGVPFLLLMTAIGFLLFKRQRNRKQFSPASHNSSEYQATPVTQAPSELGSKPIPMHQAHSWQSQQQQPFLSELSAENRSAW